MTDETDTYMIVKVFIAEKGKEKYIPGFHGRMCLCTSAVQDSLVVLVEILQRNGLCQSPYSK